MKRAFKLILILLSILSCIAILALTKLILCNPSKRIYYAYRIKYFFSRIFVLILGIKVELSGEKDLLKQGGVFFVSNHLSYIDGITMSSLTPLVFIGRSDLRDWPLLGTLSALSYTIFVDRISPSNIHSEIDKIESFLNQGINVILFPEGTSTGGTKLLPFKSSFFKVAVDTECPLVPVAINYLKIDGKNIDQTNKDLVYWYGEMDFLPHFLKVLGLKKIELEIKICKPIDILRLQGEVPSIQRKYLSNASKEAIEEHLG